jgi:hypothetical protein
VIWNQQEFGFGLALQSHQRLLMISRNVGDPGLSSHLFAVFRERRVKSRQVVVELIDVAD